MNVSEIMRRSVVIVRRFDSLEQAAKLMLQHNLRGLPVVDAEGKICGFISVSDYLAKDKHFPFSRYSALQLFGKWVPMEGIEQIYEEARAITVDQVMSAPALTVKEDDPVEELIELMLSYGLSRIPVVRDGTPIGIVARFDLLKMMIHKSSDSQNTGTPAAEHGGAAKKESLE
jgi:CBS domain-containing protein